MLLEAALHGHLQDVRESISGGENINVRNKYGATALFLATLHGNTELVEILMAAGADSTIPNNLRMTPLQAAEENEHEEWEL